MLCGADEARLVTLNGAGDRLYVRKGVAVVVVSERGGAAVVRGGRVPGECLATEAGGTLCGQVGGDGASECTVIAGGEWLLRDVSVVDTVTGRRGMWW